MLARLRRHKLAALIALVGIAIVVGYGLRPVSRALTIARPPRKALTRAPRWTT